MEDQVVDIPKQITDRQLSVLISLWRLNHYKQSPWSTWSILFSKRRPRRSVSPILCFDTNMYQGLVKQRDEEYKRKQLHQHQIWQHVQDRLGEQNKILEQEKEELDTQDEEQVLSPTFSSTSSTTITPGSSCSPELKPTARRIRWGLHNNMTKKFDKTRPITLVKVPAVDKRPVKSALKVRTAHTIQKQTSTSSTLKNSTNPKATTITTATTTTTTTTTTKTAANNTSTTKKSFPARKKAVDFF